jgi:hypothetical protein
MNTPVLPISVIAVDAPEGEKHYVVLTPVGRVLERGIAAEAIVGELLHPLRQGQGITPENFARNTLFVDFLHAVIAEHGLLVPALVAEAKRQVEGWVYIVDGRAATPQGSVSPEDILGAFQVRRGAMVAGSYQRNRNHAVLSARGFFRLDPVLQEKLCSALAERA